MCRELGTVARPPYVVEWTEEAWAEVEELAVFERRAVLHAVEALRYQAETATRNRKPLSEPLQLLPEATWEVRVGGKFRVLYAVHAASEASEDQKTVEILRAIIKERETTAEALRRKP